VVLQPIPGVRIDPPPRPAPAAIRSLQARSGRIGRLSGVGYRATVRFNHARSTLLAAGTTYYLFLALLSVITLTYGLTALLGTQWLSRYITEAVSEAFPGVAGEYLDSELLESSGQTASIVSSVALLYSATGAVMAASRSLHIIFGAPKDSRPFVLARLRAAGWLLVLAPLVLLSYVGSSIVTTLSDRVLELVGIEWSGPRVLVAAVAGVLTLGLDFVVVRLLLSRLGGLRPGSSALFWGSVVGAVALEALKLAMAALLGFVVAKPQYGALAAPIGIMFVLFLQSLALYGAAALTAGIADGDHPEP
jgi:membrane protein